MLAKVTSFGIHGLTGYPVTVEADLSTPQGQAAPGFEVVGLPDAAVKESRERVRAALVNAGFRFPTQRITVNLAPADTRKIGPIYDLPIALSLLVAQGQLPAQALENTVFLGELSLGGELSAIHGALPMALAARAAGYARLLLPAGNGAEASCVEGIAVYGMKSLSQTVAYLRDKLTLAPVKSSFSAQAPAMETANDFSVIRGQYLAKRALEIAAAGGHNLLMVGPPGSGKTMMARAFPGILPPLTYEESLEVTNIHSIAGILPEGSGLLALRPFRSPHHSASAVSIVGGGPNMVPGEVSRAHNGVLFLDELPEFPRAIIDSLRQPLEDGVMTISRARGTVAYPARFIFLAAMNPCPCGNHGSSRPCACTARQVEQYRGRVSGPVVDRIDMQLELEDVPFTELVSRKRAESSADIRARVIAARQIQLRRYQGLGLYCNAQLTQAQLDTFCPLSPQDERMARTFFESRRATARVLNRMIKVARTIADLDASPVIRSEHLAEAFQYHLPARE